MNKVIKFINSKNEEIEISIKPPFLLTLFTESTNVEIYSNKGMLQAGSTYINNTVDIKDISLEFVVRAESKEELIRCRSEINKIFNPSNGLGVLHYKDEVKEYTINCIVNKLPVFHRVNDVNFKCLISLVANFPYWSDTSMTSIDIAYWQGEFSFPFEIPDNEGIEFGSRNEQLITNIYNRGDVATGIIIEFKALSNVKNPSLLNVVTREFIKINKDMKAGEVLKIDTRFNSKSIESHFDGEIVNVFNHIDLDSTFLQLETGDNHLKYDAEENINSLEVTIKFNNCYIGV